VITRQLQVKRGTGKVRRSKTGVLPLCNATNQNAVSDLQVWAVLELSGGFQGGWEWGGEWYGEREPAAGAAGSGPPI